MGEVIADRADVSCCVGVFGPGIGVRVGESEGVERANVDEVCV